MHCRDRIRQYVRLPSLVHTRTLQSCEAPPGSFRSLLTSGYAMPRRCRASGRRKRVDDGWCHRTEGGFEGSTTAPEAPLAAPVTAVTAARGRASRSADPTAGHREIRIRPAAHLGAHALLGT